MPYGYFSFIFCMGSFAYTYPSYWPTELVALVLFGRLIQTFAHPFSFARQPTFHKDQGLVGQQ